MSKSRLNISLFVGGAVLLAGAVLLLTKNYPPVHSTETQGAIGQRQVYRDPQESAGDLKIQAGAAPVVAKTLMESKEFKKIASQPEYKSLVSSEAFSALLANPEALRAAATPNFAVFLASYSQYLQAQSAFQGTAQSGMQSNFFGWAQANMQGNMLANMQQFAALANSPAFAALARSSEFMAMVQSSNFHALAQSGLMASFLQSGAFQSAMRAYAQSAAASPE